MVKEMVKVVNGGGDGDGGGDGGVKMLLKLLLTMMKKTKEIYDKKYSGNTITERF